MYKLNDILLSVYGITPGRIKGEGIAVKGIFDLPKRTGDTHKSWGDENSVEPYVGGDEIFLSGRYILFTGIIMGSNAEVEVYITALKSAVQSFTSPVQFVTPYGTACVLVKKITPKLYNGGATILIEFREPVVGHDCTEVIIDPIIYYSAEYSETAERNNCDNGYHGSTVQLTAVEGQFTSTFSQEAADLLAIDWVRDNVQDYANVQGTCIVNPVVYWNTRQVGELARDNCALGLVGSVVTHEVEPFTYNSIISQQDADDQALAEIASILTQAYANDNGTCEVSPDFYEIYNDVGSYLGQTTGRHQQFLVGPVITVGQIYNVMIYGVVKSYETQAGDTPTDIVNGLVLLINNTTPEQWDADLQYPGPNVFGFDPSANLIDSNILAIYFILGEAIGWIS